MTREQKHKIFQRIRNQARKTVHYVGINMFLKAQDNTCPICNETLYSRDVTIDHVFPLKDNIENAGNILLCHFECNRDKSDRLPTEDEINMLIIVNERLGYNNISKRYRVKNDCITNHNKLTMFYNELKLRNAPQSQLNNISRKLNIIEETLGWFCKYISADVC